MKNIAVVLAGGTGSRMGSVLPKQFIEVEGKPIIAYSIDTFQSSPLIDEIKVVVHPQYIDTMQAICSRYGWTKVSAVLPGGNERYRSSLNAVNSCNADEECNLILHDAARPWLSGAIVQRVVEALKVHPAVGVGIPSTDTVWQLSPSAMTIGHIPDRKFMYRAQTPQAFRLSLIAEAYRRALQDPDFQATDDCGVVLRYLPDQPIYVVEGSEQNIKITFPEDLENKH